MGKLTNIRLLRVQYVPKELEPGILYVSEEFGAAIHLCACGCGRKVSTPLRPPRWVLHETVAGPTLNPSIGNWEFPCQSHYWIREGNIVWSSKWTPEQIVAGRRAEEDRRRAYYNAPDRDHVSFLRKLLRWLLGLFRGK
jgi:hypothetical protein